MTERERLQLHGPVATMQSEFAEFDRPSGDWAVARPGPLLTFDRDGGVAGRPRRKKTGLEELDFGISAEGVVETVVHQDEEGRPREVSLMNGQQEVLRRIVFTRDPRGRPATVQVFVGSSFDPAITQALASASDEGREGFDAMLAAVMPGHVFLTVTYRYDDRGRVSALTRSMGALSEENVAYVYDGMGNVAEEHHRCSSRDGSFGESGVLRFDNESFTEEWTRYEYRYDGHGNWIERVVLSRRAPEGEYRQSAIERRTITYFE